MAICRHGLCGNIGMKYCFTNGVFTFCQSIGGNNGGEKYFTITQIFNVK